MKRIIYLSAFVLLLFSACENKSSFVVKGLIKDNKKGKGYIQLNRVDVNIPVFIDSAKVSKGGRFKFRVKAGLPDFYQLGFSSSDFVTLLASPGEKINLTFDGKPLYENYIVEGSEGTEKIKLLDSDLEITKRKLDSLSTLYDKAASEPGFESRGPELEKQFLSVLKAQRKKNIEFIIRNLNSLASIKALYQRVNDNTYVLYDPKDLQYLKIVNDTLSKYYPKSRHVQALSADFEREMGQLSNNQIQAMAKNANEVKLDPNLKTVNGNRIALSSLKGKYVLLTFWSVRSTACIEENLQLKEYYKQYSKRGFEIYQVNVDENEQVWKNAVQFDELPWISTREDDPSDPLNVKLFNVKSLPANFLFDREGKIIATDLHGRSLQIKLNQLFNQ
ncbi:MAG TPA: TlpA disulfide reductase family protein [Bacteroidales bacterium]|nr:TlpA disulfide reductase family protein [Bacteroidales bacterium]